MPSLSHLLLPGSLGEGSTEEDLKCSLNLTHNSNPDVGSQSLLLLVLHLGARVTEVGFKARSEHKDAAQHSGPDMGLQAQDGGILPVR